MSSTYPSPTILAKTVATNKKIAYFFHSELKKSLSPFPMLIKPLYIVYRNIRYTENNIDKECGEIFGFV